MPLHVHIVTLFPEYFRSVLETTMLRKAQERGAVRFTLHDVRAHAAGRHRVTDDTPYGGGSGMVMKPEPLVAAIEAATDESEAPRRILLSPQGRVFNQRQAERLARERALVLVCGRYEGVDERVRAFVDEELSIGDYVLSGGEAAAVVVIEAVTRLLPGALGDQHSAAEESFRGGLLEYPQYTRPPEFRGHRVPEVLLSGDHAAIARWRRQQSLRRTWERRPELLREADLDEDDRAFLESLARQGRSR